MIKKIEKIGNKEIEISHVQDHRMWVHSNTLGFGRWISNLRLVSIIKKEIECPQCGGTGIMGDEKSNAECDNCLGKGVVIKDGKNN